MAHPHGTCAPKSLCLCILKALTRDMVCLEPGWIAVVRGPSHPSAHAVLWSCPARLVCTVHGEMKSSERGKEPLSCVLVCVGAAGSDCGKGVLIADVRNHWAEQKLLGLNGVMLFPISQFQGTAAAQLPIK